MQLHARVCAAVFCAAVMACAAARVCAAVGAYADAKARAVVLCAAQGGGGCYCNRKNS